jgi:ribosomal protein S18 acetylase RimI-like enzyme
VEDVEGSLDSAEYKSQHRYIGFLDDVPVATSAMVADSGVAGIYGLATLPEARRKGIGEVMTVMPLIEAREMGYRVGTIQASSMGYPLYARIGYKDFGTFGMHLQSSNRKEE